MITVCLDTNVLASGVLGTRNPRSAPGAIFRAWKDGAFRLVLSEHILEELARTLREPYFRARLTQEEVEAAVRALRRRSQVVVLTNRVAGVASHPEDDVVLSTALSGRADFFVTGDTALRELGQLRGVIVLSPRAFLQVLPQA